MSREEAPAEVADDLLEDAPCGYLSTRPDGTILRVNRTLERWTGRSRAELLDGVRFQDLLAPGAQIYHETHYAPMLQLHGAVREIAVELVRADGSRLPALVNSVLVTDASGRPGEVRTVVFDATERRRYEEALLEARRREQETARHLQRSLLADALPEPDGASLGAAYRPGERGLEVGGDWYDAFAVGDDGTLAVVVGDIVGRGLDAAATMGQLRSAVRALFSTGMGPAAVLAGLDDFARRHGVGQFATVVCGQLDLGARRLRFASAGHLPPILLAPGRAPELVWEARTLPLDAHPLGPAERVEAALDLPPGAAVVLYTDGLVERRGEALDDGLARLTGAAAEVAALPAGQIPEALVHALHEGAPDDDVCVLAVRVAAP